MVFARLKRARLLGLQTVNVQELPTHWKLSSGYLRFEEMERWRMMPRKLLKLDGNMEPLQGRSGRSAHRLFRTIELGC